MGFFKNLFGKRSRKEEREELHPFHKIRVRINGELFRMTDYSESGMACEREDGKATPFAIDENETVSADFLIFGYRKATSRVKIMWKNGKGFGAKVVDAKAFTDFANQYLSFVKSK